MDRGNNKVLHTVVCKVALSVQACSRLRTPEIAEQINSETVPRSLLRRSGDFTYQTETPKGSPDSQM